MPESVIFYGIGPNNVAVPLRVDDAGRLLSSIPFAGTLNGLLVINGGQTDFPLTVQSASYSQIRLKMPIAAGSPTYRNVALHVDSDGAFDIVGNGYVENWPLASSPTWRTFDNTRPTSLWSLDSAGYPCYYYFPSGGANPLSAPGTSPFGTPYFELHAVPGSPDVIRIGCLRGGGEFSFVTCPVDPGTTVEAFHVTTLGKIITKASTTGSAGFNLPHGVAPTNPVNGDEWTTTAGKFIRINGVTKQFTLT